MRVSQRVDWSVREPVGNMMAAAGSSTHPIEEGRTAGLKKMFWLCRNRLRGSLSCALLAFWALLNLIEGFLLCVETLFALHATQVIGCIVQASMSLKPPFFSQAVCSGSWCVAGAAVAKSGRKASAIHLYTCPAWSLSLITTLQQMLLEKRGYFGAPF